MAIETRSFGGSGGLSFNIEAVKSLGLRSGQYVDALLLNGVRYGGNGGRESTVLDFRPDEYIRRIAIRHGEVIDAVEFETNLGRIVGGGGMGGIAEELTNIRVLGLGGNAAALLDTLRARVITNYTEATLVETDQPAIVNLVVPGESIERAISREVSRLSAATRIMETVFDVGANADFDSDALGEFIAKLTAQTSLKTTSRSEIREEVRTIEQSSERTTFSPQEGSVGVEIVRVDVFRDPDGFAWVFPLGESQILSIPIDTGLPAAIAAYDLTGLLAAQVPAMIPRREPRNGYDYYRTADAPVEVPCPPSTPTPAQGS